MFLIIQIQLFKKKIIQIQFNIGFYNLKVFFQIKLILNYSKYFS